MRIVRRHEVGGPANSQSQDGVKKIGQVTIGLGFEQAFERHLQIAMGEALSNPVKRAVLPSGANGEDSSSPQAQEIDTALEVTLHTVGLREYRKKGSGLFSMIMGARWRIIATTDGSGLSMNLVLFTKARCKRLTTG